MSWRSSRCDGPLRDAEAPFIHVEDDGIPAGSPDGCGAGRRGPSSLSAVRRRFADLAARIDGRLLGDVIGCASLFATIYLLLILAGALT